MSGFFADIVDVIGGGSQKRAREAVAQAEANRRMQREVAEESIEAGERVAIAEQEARAKSVKLAVVGGVVLVAILGAVFVMRS